MICLDKIFQEEYISQDYKRRFLKHLKGYTHDMYKYLEGNDYSVGSKKKNTLLLATLAAGAYAYFSKKENRDKAQVAFNNMKTKVDSFIATQKIQNEPETKAGNPDPYDIPDNKMVSEGAQTSVHYYNQEVQDDEDTDGLYKEKDS